MFDENETKTVYAFGDDYKYIGEKILDSTDRSQNSGDWQIPWGCVELVPPAARQGYDIYWNVTAWEYKEILQEPEPAQPTLEELKTQKLLQVQAWTQTAIVAGFNSDCAGVSGRFDSDLDTQITMQGIALNVNSEQFTVEYPDGCPVRGYRNGDTNKTVFLLTPIQVLQFCADQSRHIGACKQRGWELQQEVALAETEDALEAIVW